MKNNFFKTRDIINYFSRQYLGGKVLNFGLGTFKYKNVILEKADSCVNFNSVSGDGADSVGDFYNLPFENNEFDVAISTDTLEHLTEPALAVGEIRRVLKVDGICLITVPFLISYHQKPDDFFRFTKSGIRYLLEKNNFQIIELGTYGRIFSTLTESVQMAYFPNKKFRGQESIIKYAQKFAFFLDKFVKNDKIYSNVYVIAKKY
ncbi:MAG: methyltransferase domain-containing protein [Patescibacteria group bacterium]|jgi:ubiquinone/menaquinone biosynthesis C-methylase UbiE